MTVQTNTNVASFNGNGVTQIFPIAFKFNNDTDLVVLLVDDATGSASLLTLNSDYTVSGEDDEEGGLINVVVAPAIGKRLKVTRVVDILQLTDLRNQGKFFAEVHEDAFDLLTMIAQQHESGINSSLRVAESDPEPARIPAVAQRAGKILSFDANGNPQVVAPVADSSTELRQELAGSGGAAMIGGGGQVVSSISALRALVKSNPSKSAFVAGYYAPGDGGGGAYYLDSTDTVSGDDGGSVIVADDGGRWKLASRMAISVRQFGAKGDGVTDDTLAINRLISLANGRTQGTTVYFPDGRYLIPAGLSPITNGIGEVWLVGQSSGGTEILTQSGSLISWGDATSPLVVGGGARSLKIKYASAPAAESNVFRFEYCSRLQFDDLLLENIGTLAWCGASAERFASALTFSNIRGSTHNGGGQALFRLRYGAGLFLSNVSEFVGGVGHPTHPASMTTAASMYLFDCTVGNWDTVQAVNCIFERWGSGLVVAPSSGSVYQNLYFSNCIFDYFKGQIVYIDTAGGGTCAGVRMENCWYVSWETAAIELIGTAGYNDGHRFTGDVPIAGKQAVSYNMPNAKSVKFVLDIGQPNRLGGYNAMEFGAGSKGFVVEGCTGNNDGAAVGLPWRGAYGVSVQGNCDNFTVVGNKITGPTAPYSLASNASGSKLRRVANNADANYAGTSGMLALAGSGVSAVNKSPFDIEVAIFGGSVSGISKNAVGISGMISGTLRLGPGESITVTYSVAPSLTAIALN